MTVSVFNKPPPPGFRGLQPDLPLRVYYRHLPHWRQDGATYAVTFRLTDSIPQNRLRVLKRWRLNWERQNPPPRSESAWKTFAQHVSNRTETWMDEGYGSCVLRDPRFSRQMAESLQHFQNVRHITSCFVVMPNHVHVVMKPLDGHELEDCLQRIKQFVATQINSTLAKSGQVWTEESHDRIIRDEEHLWNVIQYIGRNPAKARIPRHEWVRWIHPDWEVAGWGFNST